MGSNMQKEIQLTDKTLLVVGLPEGIFGSCEVVFNHFGCWLQYLTNKPVLRPIPRGYKLLGIYPELTEEQAKMVIPSKFYNTIHGKVSVYVDFIHELNYCKTALESFQYLMERENITDYDKYAILIKSK